MTYIEDLLHDRYYQPGESSWADLTNRVIDYVYEGASDQERGRAREALLNREFVPSSPVLMNSGTRYPMMCSCFVLPVHDNIQSIMETLSNTVFIQKFGGGVGINFSEIRPDGSTIESTNGVASGPVSFMGLWNAGMNVIRQGGKRQGAMMGILGVDHPDLPLFLAAKQREGKLTNFNLSVMLPGEFWKRDRGVRDAQLREIAEHTWANGEPGVLFRDNINEERPYGDLEINATNPCLPQYVDMISKHNGMVQLADIEVGDQVWSSEGWTTVIAKTYRGEKEVWRYYSYPGRELSATPNHRIVTMDEEKIPIDDAEEFKGFGNLYTGEGFYPRTIDGKTKVGTLPVWDITVDNESHTFWCNGIDVANCGEVPLPPYGACCLGSINLTAALEYDEGQNRYRINRAKLLSLTYLGVTFLNRVLDRTWWPIDKIAAFENRYRPIGLGVMGLADVLASLRIPYGSSEAQAYVRHLMGLIRYWAEQAGRQYADWNETPMNATLLSVAPTGSISMLAGCSYSIEPYFTFTGQKRVEAGEFDIDSSIVERVAHLFGEELTGSDWATITETGSVAETGLSDEAKDVLRTANEIPWEDHIRMQAAVQQHVDSAVSKTVNMPNSATVDDVVHAITMAWAHGCKGLTLYRSGSREDEVITGTDDSPTVNEDGFLECEVCEI